MTKTALIAALATFLVVAGTVLCLAAVRSSKALPGAFGASPSPRYRAIAVGDWMVVTDGDTGRSWGHRVGDNTTSFGGYDRWFDYGEPK